MLASQPPNQLSVSVSQLVGWSLTLSDSLTAFLLLAPKVLSEGNMVIWNVIWTTGYHIITYFLKSLTKSFGAYYFGPKFLSGVSE